MILIIIVGDNEIPTAIYVVRAFTLLNLSLVDYTYKVTITFGLLYNNDNNFFVFF